MVICPAYHTPQGIALPRSGQWGYPMGKLSHWAISCNTGAVSETNLRESKRRATASALAQAAFDLALDRGVDGFTIDELAARAGYSRRTFANYYSGKEDAIVAVAVERVVHALDTTPDENLPLVEWLHAVARQQLSDGLLNVLQELRTLSEEYPPLRPHVLQVQRLIRQTALDAVLNRRDVSPIHAHLLVGAAYGALTSVLEGHISIRSHDSPESPGHETEPSMTLDSFLNLTFAHLRDGF